MINLQQTVIIITNVVCATKTRLNDNSELKLLSYTVVRLDRDCHCGVWIVILYYIIIILSQNTYWCFL